MNADHPATRTHRACAGFARARAYGVRIVATAAAALVANVSDAAAAGGSGAGDKVTLASMHWAFQPLKAPRTSQAARPVARKASIDDFTARRLRDLKVTDAELNAPEQVERTPRMLQAPEFDVVDEDALVSLLEPRELRAYGWSGAHDHDTRDHGAGRRSTVNE